MAGKNGSTWKHGWDPTNPAAVALKTHRAPGASAPASHLPVPASFRAPKGTGPAKSKTARAAAKKPAPATVKSNSFLPVPASFSGPKGSGTAKSKTSTVAPGLSKSYASGKGATAGDVAELARRYEVMHGKPPSAKQVAKIKKAPSAKPSKAAAPKTSPMADLLKLAKPASTATPRQPAKTTEQHIHDAVTAAGGKPGDFVKVTDVKNHMTGMTEAEKDHALATAFASGKVNLIPQSNQQALTAEQRKRAVNVGGETKHLISFT